MTHKNTGFYSLLFVLVTILVAHPVEKTAFADSHTRHRTVYENRVYDAHHAERGWHRGNYKERVRYITPSYYTPRYQVISYRPRGVEFVQTYYRVGEYLPRHIRCHEPPRGVVAALPPVHVGTRYVQVDEDIYLIAEATKQILDAIVLVSGR